MRFRSEVLRAVGVVRRSPLIGMQMTGAVRTWPLRVFPFRVVYVVLDGAVIVVALAHMRRRPRYWRSRLRR